MRFLRRQLNKVRLTLLVAILFTLLASIVFRTPPIVFMAALLMSAPLLAALSGRRGGRGLLVTRTMPSIASAGDNINARLEVFNPAPWPLLLAQIEAGIEGEDDTQSTLSGDTARGDTARGDTARVTLQFGAPDYVAPLLRPRERVVWRQRWKAQRRGVARFAPVRAGTGDPLGLFWFPHAKTPSHEVLILPRPLKIDRLGFLGGAAMGLQSRHIVAAADTLDYHGIRAWQVGEGIRRVHWKSTARTGQLHIVEWEDSAARDLCVLLDTQAATQAGARGDDTLEAAIVLVASIGAHLLENGCSFQLFFWRSPPPSQQTEGGAQRQSTLWRNRPPARGAVVNENQAPPQLGACESHNANGVGALLRALAHIEAVEHSGATLAALAERCAPLIPKARGVLLIAPSGTGVEGARKVLCAAPGASRPHALLLDQASFEAAGQSAAPATARPVASTNAVVPSRDGRIVYYGESPAAVLERLP